MLAWWLCSMQNEFNEEYLTQYHTPFLTTHWYCQIAMGAWPLYYVWPLPSHLIFESSDNWLHTYTADRRWPITMLLIGRHGQSRAQRALVGGCSGFYSSDLDTAVHPGICETELFLRYWPFVRGIHRSPVNSTHNGQWRGTLMFSLTYI